MALTPKGKQGGENTAQLLDSSPKVEYNIAQPEEEKKSSEQIKSDFKRDLDRMKEMQGRVELPPDETEKMRKADP